MVRRRRRARLAKIASLVLLALVLAGTAAFGVDRGIVFGRHLWARLHRPSPPTSTTTTLYSAPPTTLPAPQCDDRQTNAYLYDWEITSGTLYEVVALTNTSSSPCSLAGYATLVATDQNGAALPSPNHAQASLGAGAGASPTPVLLTPDGQAWFEFSYPVTCSQVLVPGPTEAVVPGDCFEGATLAVSVSGGGTTTAGTTAGTTTGGAATTTLDVRQPVRFTYGVEGFAVGPFASGTPPASPPVS